MAVQLDPTDPIIPRPWVVAKPASERGTIPKFVLTNHKTVKIKRAGAGIIEKGKKVVGHPFELEIEANVQPLQYKDIMQMTETDRTKEWIKVYSAEIIRTMTEGDNGAEADIILWDRQQYKVMRVKSYKMGVLDHYCAYAARIPISAGNL